MAHTCNALIMHCMDFRFGPDIKQFMEERNMLGDCDLVAFAGAAQNLLKPEFQAFAQRQIELSKRLHGISEVHLMNHMDCGAYGGRAAFADRDAEKAAHAADLISAAAVIKAQHPELAVLLWIAHIEDQDHGHHISFEQVMA